MSVAVETLDPAELGPERPRVDELYRHDGEEIPYNMNMIEWPDQRLIVNPNSP